MCVHVCECFAHACVCVCVGVLGVVNVWSCVCTFSFSNLLEKLTLHLPKSAEKKQASVWQDPLPQDPAAARKEGMHRPCCCCLCD